jgi:hypothetical protein
LTFHKLIWLIVVSFENSCSWNRLLKNRYWRISLIRCRKKLQGYCI